jgi:hypothetical protein
MNSRHGILRRWILALLIAACLPTVSFAAGWLDDFNDGSATDGNPLTWLEDLGGSGLFPGDYNASSGDYVLKPTADGVDSSIMISLVPTTTFSNVYMRTQGTVLPDPSNPANVGGNLVLLGRVDPTTLTGYLVYFDVSGNLNLQILAGGDTLDIGTTWDSPFNASSEVVVEMDIVGNQLSAYAWLADDPAGKPAEPQVTATDDTFAAGISGIAFAEDDDGTTGVYRYVAAQDTPFVDATPGDFNGDSAVDGADFITWQRGFPDSHTAADLAAWQGQFSGGGGGASAVPEPTGLAAAIVVGIVGLAAGRGRQRRADARRP